jgi:AP-3 complex subunit delta-1
MSKNQYEAGVALNALSNICTPDLARDLAPDIVSMLTSSRPYIRKKACLVLYKVFLKFPEALRPAFARLKDKLDDADTCSLIQSISFRSRMARVLTLFSFFLFFVLHTIAVVSAAVNVICELARKNPKNYVPLAPTLFKILTTSQNNWMLIKIIKLVCIAVYHLDCMWDASI